MKLNRLSALCLSLTLLTSLVSGCAKSKGPDAPKDPDNYLPLASEEDVNDKLVISEDFDLNKVEYVMVHVDEQGDYEVRDKKVISQLLKGLQKVEVHGLYQDNVFMTDSGTGISFFMPDDIVYVIHFDHNMKTIYLNGEMYECSETKDLSDIIWEIQNPQNQ